jgi:hypothetical protein
MLFAECWWSGTRQRDLFTEYRVRGTRQRYNFFLEMPVLSPSPVGKPYIIVLQVYNSYTDTSNKLIDHKFYKSLTTKLTSNAK